MYCNSYYKDNTASYTCVCEAGWTGFNCNQNINDCDPNPCLTGAKCNVSAAAKVVINNAEITFIVMYSCITYTAMTEYFQDGVSGFTCSCVTGWTGDTCNTNINDCREDSCMNGGTCQVSVIFVRIITYFDEVNLTIRI